MSTLDGEVQLRLLRAVEGFEDAWRRGEPIPLEDLLRGAAGAERDELLRNALAVELEFRRRGGESPTREQYLGRFPGQRKAVEECFSMQSTLSVPREFTLDDLTPGDSVTPRPDAWDEEPLPKTIGKYVVLRRLVKGGF
jgi:hypothetical protein